MLHANFIILAIILRASGTLSYMISVLRGQTRPHIVSWFFWGLAPMMAFFAQWQEQGVITPQAWVTFALGLGPFMILGASLVKHKPDWSFTKLDVVCAILAATGLIVWQLTNNPMLALMLGMAADIAAGVPTYTKAYRSPGSEYAPAYFITSIAMAITLLTITEWKFVVYAFPLYMLIGNALMAAIIIIKPLLLTFRESETGTVVTDAS
jgi:hypothetical protein